MKYLNKLIAIEKLYNLEVFKAALLPDPLQAKKNEKEEGGVNVQMYIDRYTIAEDVVLYYVRLRYLRDNKGIWTLRWSGCLSTDTATSATSMKP